MLAVERPSGRLAVLALAIATLGGCHAADAAATASLPNGSYAGSNAAAQAVTVEVSNGTVVYDGWPTSRLPGGGYRSRHYRVNLSCRPIDRQTELVCRVGSAESTQTVELMKL